MDETPELLGYCRCSRFEAGILVSKEGRLVCGRCGKLIDSYIQGNEKDAEIIPFPSKES